MALLFIDSFDHYGKNNILAKYNSISAIANVDITLEGRNGTYGLKNFGWVKKTLGSLPTTVIVGFAFKSTSLPSSGNQALVTLWDDVQAQVILVLMTDGRLKIRNGASVDLGVSTQALQASIWYYIEMKCLINNGAGTVEVHINEAEAINLTGVDTQVSSNAQVSAVSFHGNGVNYSMFDDLYICDTLGAGLTDFLDDIRVEALLPDADGSYSQWTPSTGINHYAVVDENPASMTDYISETNSGDRDSFTFPSLVTTSGNVLAVQTVFFGDKDDAGLRTIRDFVRIGGTDYDGVSRNVNTTAAFYTDVLEDNPDTASAWLIAEVNSIEAGVELVI